MALIVAVIAIGLSLSDGGDEEETAPSTTAVSSSPPSSTSLSSFGAPLQTRQKLDQLVQIAPVKSDPLGVDESAGFVVSSDSPLSASAVASAVETTPHAALVYTQTTRNEVLAAPVAPLQAGLVYRFSVASTKGPTSFAFQTRSPFRIIGTLPRTSATNVPPTTGVEVQFSSSLWGDPEPAFRIDPHVSGRFERHRETLAFVPDELAPQTLYTVTIAKTLKVADTNERLDEDFVFQFETGTGGAVSPVRLPAVSFSRTLNEWPATEAPVLGVSGTNAGGSTAHLQVFRYPSVEGFAAALRNYNAVPSWAFFARSSLRVDTTALEAVAEFDVGVEPPRDGYPGVVTLPSTFAPGWYVVEGTAGESTTFTFLQVTSVATHVTVSTNVMLVWANSVEDGSPIGNASVRLLGGDQLGETNADGVLTVATPDVFKARTPSQQFLLVTADGRSIVVPVNGPGSSFGFYGDSRTEAGRFWRTMVSDRQLYESNDTIRIWGLLRRREGPALQTVELTATRDDASFGARTVAPSARVPVVWLDDETFRADVPLSAAASGSYVLRLIGDGEPLVSTYVQVKQFIKPGYRLVVTANPAVAFSGEVVRFDISARFFDGTPVPNLPLRFTGVAPNLAGLASNTITTDERGGASISATAKASGYDSVLSVAVRPARAEEGDIEGFASARVLTAAVRVTAIARTKNGTATIEGTVGAVNRTLEAANTWVAAPGQTPIAGATVDLSITPVVYDRTQVGTYYDYVEKRVVPRYQYTRRTLEPVVASLTTDESGRFSYHVAEDGRNYEISARARDDQGRVAEWRGGFYEDRSSTDAVRATLDRSDPYQVGEALTLTVERSLPFPAGTRFLYMVERAGIRSWTVSDSNVIQTLVAEEYRPSFWVQVVAFSGRTFLTTGTYVAVYSPRLKVTVGVDKDVYRPRDGFVVDVNVVDDEGKPTSADVFITLVDASIIAMQDSHSPALSLAWDSPGVITSYSSHQVPIPMPGGQGSGGGSPRTDFANTAFTATVRTDDTGHATVKGTLPDNLGAWHVSARAVSKSPAVGEGFNTIRVQIPLFLQATVEPMYIVGDAPTIRVRAYRSAGSDADVAMRVRVPTLGIDTSGSTTIGSEYAVTLPALPAGVHQVRIDGASGTDEDSLVRTFTVAPSPASISHVTVHELPRDKLADVSGPAVVWVTDANRGRYLPVLQRHLSPWSSRVDALIGRTWVSRLLLEHFAVAAPTTEVDPSVYQQVDGGLALLPYGSSDLYLSALAARAGIAPREPLRDYLRRASMSGTESPDRQAMALMGLSAMGEPVLLDVQRQLAMRDVPEMTRLYLGLAAASLGDQLTAQQAWRSLEPRVKELDGVARLEVGDDNEQYLHATALGATLALAVDQDEAWRLFTFVQRNLPRERLLTLEQLWYLASALPDTPSEALEVSFNSDGKVEQRSLRVGETVRLDVPDGQLHTLDLRVTKGAAQVVTQTQEPLETAAGAPAPGITVSRRYLVDGKEAAAIKSSDTIHVEITVVIDNRGVDGCYIVTDHLPAGMHATNLRHQPATQNGIPTGPVEIRPFAIDGQRVLFCASKSSPFTRYAYDARVSSPGVFHVAPVIVQSAAAPALYATTNATFLTIGS